MAKQHIPEMTEELRVAIRYNTVDIPSLSNTLATSRISSIVRQISIPRFRNRFGFYVISMYATVALTLTTSQHNSRRLITATTNQQTSKSTGRTRSTLSICIHGEEGMMSGNIDLDNGKEQLKGKDK
ncbi:hypothetical protein B0O99DRAFT_746556 [Bisporella sp. PMI_857]|nr:hypothetical protein B0O99DRAFT_746556 [Bisporella sp. PMI_857]